MAEIDLRFSPVVSLGSAVRIGTDAAAWGDRALIVADAAVEAAALGVQEQLDALGIKAIVYIRLGLSSRSDFLDEALSLSRGSRADLVVSMGGEKVMSLGRLVAALSPYRTYAADILDNPHVHIQGLPLLELPSSGHHALMYRNQAVLEEDSNDRTVLAAYPAPPNHLVLVDSALQGKMSKGATVVAAAARLASAAEAYLSPRASFLSEIQARSAVEAAVDLCRRVKDESEDPDFRSREAESAVLSGIAVGLTGPGPGVALAWAASAASSVSATSARAVLLPWVIESPIYAGSPGLTKLASLIAGPEADSVADPAEEVRSLFGRMGVAGRLREIGADLGDLIPAAGWAAAMASPDRADFAEGALRDILELSC